MHRYVVVRIATSSWRIWSPGFQFLGFPLFSHSIPYNGLSVSIFISLYCFKEECNFGKFVLYWDFFPPFLVSPTVSPCSTVGTQTDRWCQFTLLQIMLLIFFPNLSPDDSLSDFGVAKICLWDIQKSLPFKKNGFSQPFSSIGTKHIQTLNN